MELYLKINATQLKSDDTTFAGQRVKGEPTALFAVIPYQGGALQVHEGMWLVEYHDGTKEVWSTDQITANTDYEEIDEVDEDVRIDDETPGETEEAPDHAVVESGEATTENAVEVTIAPEAENKNSVE
jgi:hypothetical protein